MVLKVVATTTVALLMFTGCATTTTTPPKAKEKEVLVYKIDINTKKAVAKLIDKVKELEKNSSSKDIVVKKTIKNVKKTRIDNKIIEFINEKQSNK